jgi:hypothetical protein
MILKWCYVARVDAQTLTEMSTRNKQKMFLGSRARPARKTDKLIAICEPIF